MKSVRCSTQNASIWWFINNKILGDNPIPSTCVQSAVQLLRCPDLTRSPYVIAGRGVFSFDII